jgi:hypothetical protein
MECFPLANILGILCSLDVQLYGHYILPQSILYIYQWTPHEPDVTYVKVVF